MRYDNRQPSFRGWQDRRDDPSCCASDVGRDDGEEPCGRDGAERGGVLVAGEDEEATRSRKLAKDNLRVEERKVKAHGTPMAIDTASATSIHQRDHASQIHLRVQKGSGWGVNEKVSRHRTVKGKLAALTHLPPHCSAATNTVMLMMVANPIGKQPRKRL